MSFQIAEAFVQMRADTSRLNNDVSSGVRNAGRRAEGDADRAGRAVGGRFSSGMGTVLKSMVAGAVLFKGVDMFKGWIEDAAYSAKIGRMTDQVIKSTGADSWTSSKQVGNLAMAISNKTGADDEAVQSGENMLLTFTGIRNEVGKGNDIFNQATSITTDMTAAMNDGVVTQEKMKATSILVGKALNDPIKGYAALKRVGVTFTDQQKKQIDVMMKNNDVTGAQKIILGELNKEFGGQAAAAASPMMKLQTIISNLGETIGTIFLPYIDKAAKAMAKWMQSKQFQEDLKKATDAVKSFVDKLIAVAKWAIDNKNWLIPLAEAVVTLVVAFKAFSAVMGVITKIQAFITLMREWALVSKVVTAAQWLWNAALLANPIVLIIAAVVALVAIFVVLWMKCDAFRNFWKAVWAGIKVAFNAVWTFLKAAFNAMITFFTKTIPNAAKSLWNHVKANWTGMQNSVKAVYNWIRSNVLSPIVNFFTKTIPNAAVSLKNKVVGAFTSAKNSLSNIGTAIKNAVSRAFTSMYNAVKSKVNSAVTFVKGLKGKVVNFFSGAGTWLYNSGKKIIQGLVDGISHMASKVTGAVGGILKKARNLLPFSPAKTGPFSGRGWTTYSGASIVEGLASGVSSKSGTLVSSVKNALAGAKAAMNAEVEQGLLGTVKVANHGNLVSTAARATTPANNNSGNTSIENLHVHVSGTMDFTKPGQAKKVAELLVVEMKEAIRKDDRERK